MDETGTGSDAGGAGDPLEDLGGEDEFYEYPTLDGDGGGEDDGAEQDRDPHTALPGRVEAWRRRSATGAILTGFALGLQEVFEAKKDEPAVVMETSGDPPTDLPVEADFEYGRPRQSVVNVRPWLLPGAAGRDDPVAPETGTPAGGGPPADGDPSEDEV